MANDYTAAAQSIPAKLIKKLTEDADYIHPWHVQVSLTNRCNQNCSWCSCADRDKSLELNMGQISKINFKLASMRTEAVTISGGGEPTLCKGFWEAVACFKNSGMRVGLTTNGKTLHEYDVLRFRLFDWVRISLSSERLMDDNLRKVTSHPVTDWSFSWVLSGKDDGLYEVLEYAESNPSVTHCRITRDIFDPSIKTPNKGNYKKAIWQDRGTYCRGPKECWVSLLRPVICPDGSVSPCCGIQYHGSKSADGRWCRSIEEYADRVAKQQPYDGRSCTRCYYDSYNQVLSAMKSDPHHAEFL